MNPNHIERRHLNLGALLLTLGWLCSPLAHAQGKYPDKPITLVVPNAAGGAADNLARGFVEELAKRLG